MRKSKGITLIALAITIIVLIILSSVGIYLSIGNNGIIGETQKAKETTLIEQAKEKMNLKIINKQIDTYSKEQRMPTLQEFSDTLCEDDEIEYVQLQSKKVGSLEKIEVGEANSIFTKLKEYPYEFEINSFLEIITIDGIEYEKNDSNIKDIIISAITFEIQEITDKSIKIKINVDTENNEDIKGYLAYINEELVVVQDTNIITITGLEDKTTYNVKCGVMDKYGNIKQSNIKQITTNEKLQEGNKYYNRITTFEPFRVDNASSYSAYSQQNDYYYIQALNTNGRAGINTNQKVDLTDVEYIEIDAQMSNNYGTSFTGTLYLGIYTEKDSSLNFTKYVNYSTNAVSSNPENKKIKLDVSDISGEYYIKVIAVHPSNIKNYGFGVYIFSMSLQLDKEIKEINNNKQAQISTLVSDLTFEVVQVKDTSIKIQINVTSDDEENIIAYYVYTDQEIKKICNEKLITIEGLQDATGYNVKYGIIDKQGNIKESKERKVETLTNLKLQEGNKYYNRITSFTPFRVDNASSYSAYSQQNDYYYIQALNTNGRAGINTNQKVDLTDVEYIEIDAQMYNNYGTSFTGTLYLGIYTEKDSSLNFTKYVNYSTNVVYANQERKKIELDVSDISGEYYIKMVAVHPSNVTNYAFIVSLYSMSLKLETQL